MDLEQKIKLGECHRAHGLQGGMVFQLYNQVRSNSILAPGKCLLTAPLGSSAPLVPRELVQITWGAKVIGHFKGVSDRSAVENLLPFAIWVERAAFPPLADEEFYLVDLLGAKIYRHQTTILVGEVVNFYHNGAGEQVVIVMQTPTTQWELPLVKNFFPVIELEHHRLEVIWPLPEYWE